MLIFLKINRDFIRILTECPQPVNFVNLGTSERYEMNLLKYVLNK